MRLVRPGLLTIVTVAALLGLASAPAYAIAPGTNFIILVTDCKTGAPIRGGEADFAIQNFLAVGVSPIDHGVVGPVGLNTYNYILTLSAPGYREAHRVLHGLGNFSQPPTTLRICLHPVAGSPEHFVDTTYPINITCTGSGEVCDPIFTTSIVSNNVAQAQFTASLTNCGDIVVEIGLDGSFFTSDPLAPGQSTSITFQPVTAGTHEVTVQATGVEGGCNTGTLASWGGTLVVTTSMPFGPINRGQCQNGGWMRFTTPTFSSQGACVRYASSAGKHA